MSRRPSSRDFLLRSSSPGALPSTEPPLLFPFRKHVLANGLEVVLHEDRSEPVVAVYVYYHVGSSRERPGRTGLAHLFEHMLFQGSAHVQGDGHFRRIQEAGGTLNGTTNQDRTNYFETLPAHQLELALWLESDRMGFLLPAMTQEKLDNQRDVVRNERRQSYENRPYGLVHETLLAALYPPGHPYSWPTIGSMEDIGAATLEDVADFFRRFYGPNNATLAIGGDVDPEHALALAERWFGGLAPGPPVERPARWPAGLRETQRRVLEDRVALPQLSLCWPTVEHGHPDQAALDLLAEVLSANRASLLDRVLLIEEELASSVTIAHAAQERAGALTIQARPTAQVALGALEERIDELLAALVKDGVDPERLARLKARREGELFRGLETVAARTSRLAHDNLFHGDPARLGRELARLRAVGAEDVLGAAQKYLLERPRVVLSTVPLGKRERAAPPRSKERALEPSAPERARAPEPGPEHPFRAPQIWSRTANGAQVLGTPFDRVPLARLALAFPAGRRAERPETCGLATLAAEMLEEGTRRLSGVELTDRWDGLGAQLVLQADDDELALRLSVLDTHLASALELLAELVFEPRFAAADFERVRRQRLIALETRADRIGELADDAFARLVFDPENPRGAPRLGTPGTIARLEPGDLERFWREQAQLRRARIAWVDARGPDEALALLEPLTLRIGTRAETPPETTASTVASPAAGPCIHLVDKPGAAQSELRLGHLAVASTDPDFYPLQALNYVLGGAFSSRINLNLREDKGYTYGARSHVQGGLTAGAFCVSTAVQTEVTAPALAEAYREIHGILGGVTEEEVEFARRALSQALGRNLESAAARLHVLENVGRYGYPHDYLERRLAWLQGMRAAELTELARRRIRPAELVLVVAGDRERVLGPLGELGLGPVVELDAAGESV